MLHLSHFISLTFHCQPNKKSSLPGLSMWTSWATSSLCRSVPTSKCTCAHHQVLLLKVIRYVNAVQFISSAPCNSGCVCVCVHLSASSVPTFASYCDSPFQYGVVERFYELRGVGHDVKGSNRTYCAHCSGIRAYGSNYVAENLEIHGFCIGWLGNRRLRPPEGTRVLG